MGLFGMGASKPKRTKVKVVVPFNIGKTDVILYDKKKKVIADGNIVGKYEVDGDKIHIVQTSRRRAEEAVGRGLIRDGGVWIGNERYSLNQFFGIEMKDEKHMKDIEVTKWSDEVEEKEIDQKEG